MSIITPELPTDFLGGTTLLQNVDGTLGGLIFDGGPETLLVTPRVIRVIDKVSTPTLEYSVDNLLRTLGEQHAVSKVTVADDESYLIMANNGNWIICTDNLLYFGKDTDDLETNTVIDLQSTTDVKSLYNNLQQYIN